MSPKKRIEQRALHTSAHVRFSVSRHRVWDKALILALFPLLLLPQSARAIYKCVDSAGNIAFSDRPCEPGSQGETVEIKKQKRLSNQNPSSEGQAKEPVKTPEEMIERAEAIRRGEPVAPLFQE